VDPADKFCGELLKLAEAFYVHNAPVRCVCVFVCVTLHNYLCSLHALCVF
jgi:hypothetical protein